MTEPTKPIDDELEARTIAEVLASDTIIAGHTDIGKLLAETREDGRYSMAMYDCEMKIMQLITADRKQLLDSQQAAISKAVAEARKDELVKAYNAGLEDGISTNYYANRKAQLEAALTTPKERKE